MGVYEGGKRMKATERDINLLIDDADRILSALERLDDKVILGMSPEEDWTQDDVLLVDTSHCLQTGIRHIEDATRKLRRIKGEEE